MRVEHVAPDDTMPVSGYEHRTLKCPQCGDTERRLVFGSERTSTENTFVETIASIVETTIPVVDTASAVAETTNPAIETMSPIATANTGAEATSPAVTANSGVETTSPVANANFAAETTSPVETANSVVETTNPVAPTDRGPDQPGVALAKWAQTVEKVRTRHTALSQAFAAKAEKSNDAATTRNNETAAMRSNETAAARSNDVAITGSKETAPARSNQTAPARSNEAADDFDRMWESLVPPRQQPPPRNEPSRPQRRDDALRGTTPPPATTPRTPAPRPYAPFVPVRSDASVAPMQPKQSSGPKASQSAWARAVAMVRERLDRAVKLEQSDAILQIDVDALNVKSRQGQSRPPRPGRPD
jgi:hypothetical protein